MDLEGRRESSNVEDRRGMSVGRKAGIGGIGGLIIAGLITLLMGGNIGDVLQNAGSMGMGMEQQQANTDPTQFTAEEQELASFSKKILAGTEDVWTKVFQEQGLGTYTPPTMVLYTGATSTGCGQGSAQMGPFYCSADQCLYIDLSFFSSMRQQLGADGDFAYAYVIAHEVGHHVEYLTGTLDKAHQQMSRLNEADANRISVRLELLADFYAGVWAHHDNKMFRSLQQGDLEEAIQCAQVIGDDYLQKRAQGYDIPESFTHGTSAQRMKWLKLGLKTGDVRYGNTFQMSDAQL
ncbi:MAG: neutral zinc metallopeptidase [Muribaculaceae bacterium]|nr:neutral zinc metallopeptidase [Muribaculaceae bacterium]MBR1727737.1 neutral zinc metallopeptidase [Muribaculaceae bacterium]